MSVVAAGPERVVPFVLPDWIVRGPGGPPAPVNRAERRAREKRDRVFAKRVRKFYARIVARALVRFGRAVREFAAHTTCFVPFATFRYSLDSGLTYSVAETGRTYSSQPNPSNLRPKRGA